MATITTERLKELQQLYENLKLRVKEIDDKYSLEYVEPKLDMPESLNLQKLDYTSKTSKELSALAEQAVAPTMVSKQSAIERAYSTKLKSAALKRDKLKNETDKSIAQAGVDFANTLEEIKRKLINNGLVFSTVGNKYNTQANEDYKELMRKIAQESDIEATHIRQEETDAESLYHQSLASLEKERQARIADKLQKLSDEEEKLRISIEKYNNSLEEKEQKYQASRAKAYENARKAAYNRAYNNAKLYLEVGETGYRQLIQREKYAVCQDMFYPLRRGEAQTILTFDSFLVNNLGTYYSAFVDWINTVLIP